MLLIGITGGIGSGKTTVAKMFEAKGVPLYIADERAKRIMEKQEVIEKVQGVFEEHILTPQGKLDRKLLRTIVFNDEIKLARLNGIVHPEVRQDFMEWLRANEEEAFVLQESAILFEQGLDKACDYVIFVKAPVDVRIERVMKRDGVSSDRVKEIMNNQMDELEKEKRSDFVIDNIDIEEAKRQVENVFDRLKNVKNKR